MMAQVMGLPTIPSVQPSTSYYPGYEWWPYNMPAIQDYGIAETVPYSAPEGSGSMPSNAPFTFDQGQYSSNFVQGVHSPHTGEFQYPPGSHR